MFEDLAAPLALWSSTEIHTKMTVEQAILAVVNENPGLRDAATLAQQLNDEQLLELLGDVLIAHETASEATLEMVEAVLPRTRGVKPEGLWVTPQLCVCRGDITKLDVDAIVNAANDKGLGCFRPSHRCVDNVIHRAAGPRLRAACEVEMRARGPLTTGSGAIVTPGFLLPARWVVHATGPQVETLTPQHEKELAETYVAALDAAVAAGAETIAVPCISTGLFGFPSKQAARTALRTVREWLEGKHAKVFLDVFTDKDTTSYVAAVLEQKAARLIAAADAVLICAGAGASGNPGELVYTNKDDFAKHYPWLLPYGYTTAYECMGLMGDPSVPQHVKRSYFVAHAYNQRVRFQPNPAYHALLRGLKGKDTFVYTSNVDGCFERAGFDQVYTPQGDWQYMQCSKPCTRDSWWRADLAPLDAPTKELPNCPRCGRPAMGNVRGGDWFLHGPHDADQDRFLEWIDSVQNLVVIEIGVGFNTPSVTRWPMEKICAEKKAPLVRINPNDFQVPTWLPTAIGIPSDWTPDVASALFDDTSSCDLATRQLVATDDGTRRFDWRSALASLRY